MQRRQQQQHTPPVTLATRRRPVWNGYLTDDAKYRLSEQQQLQRQLQQFSTAHFAATPTRRRPPLPVAAIDPSPHDFSAARSLSVAEDEHRRQRAEVDGRSQSVARSRPGSSDSMRRRKSGATVSFKLDHGEGAQRAGLQGELAALERMLAELEVETATLNQTKTLQHQGATPPSVSFRENYREESQQQDHGEDEEQNTSVLASEDEYESDRAGSDDDHERGSEDRYGGVEDESFAGEENQERDRLAQVPSPALQYESNGVAEHDAADATLSQVCYKSLNIGVELAKRIEQLSRELDKERRLRVDSELKIEVLEQEVRSTRAKCNYLDAKYQDVASQVNDMREALIATEEAIHRMAKQQQLQLQLQLQLQQQVVETSHPRTPHRHHRLGHHLHASPHTRQGAKRISLSLAAFSTPPETSSQPLIPQPATSSTPKASSGLYAASSEPVGTSRSTTSRRSSSAVPPKKRSPRRNLFENDGSVGNT